MARTSPVFLAPPPGAATFRTAHRFALVATQAAGSKLFVFRNAGTAICALDYVRISWLPTGTHTAAIEDSLDIHRLSAATANDTTDKVDLTIEDTRTLPGTSGAVVKGVTVAGAAAGMTGGTMTKSGVPAFQLPQWLTASVPTGALVHPLVGIWRPGPGKEEVFANNEGFAIYNRVLLGAAAGSTVYVEAAWSERSTI